VSNAQQRGPSATVVAGNTPASAAPASPAPASAAPASRPGAVGGAPAAVTHDLVGTVLADRYRVLKKLGEGGMGSVYLAEHTTINKKLAIKVLSHEYSHKQDLVDRFLQEARAASMIDQENVVEINDFGSTPTGSVFFVMEYLAGEDLSDTIKTVGPMPWARVKPIMLQICAALEAAHAAGIIHRDMKPENCFRISRRGNEDFIKVLDFGIAKVTSDEGDGGRALTRTGMIFGTPEYMSPEQAKGERVDHRVDVYAVGVILYELLTGRVPFTADTFMGILTQHMFEAPPAPSTVVPTAGILPEAEAIILKALQKDREYRFQSMAELAEAIRAVGTGSAAVDVVQENVALPSTGQIHYSTGAPVVHDDDLRPPRSRAGLFVGGAVAAVVLAVGGFLAVGQLSSADEGPDVPDVPEVPEVIEAPEVVEAVEVDGSDEQQADARTVAVTIAIPGIDARIYDSRDNGLIGKSNEPLTIPLSSDPFGVHVRAEGFETELVQIVPDRDKEIPAELVKLVPDDGTAKSSPRSKPRPKTTKSGPKQSSSTESKPEPKTEPKPKPKPEPKPEPKPKPSGTSPDLKDPFSSR
jgi:eukaryotic-like serine/threonine-protein kinase